MPRSDQAKREWCNLPKVVLTNEDCSKQGIEKQYNINSCSSFFKLI